MNEAKQDGQITDIAKVHGWKYQKVKDTEKEAKVKELCFKKVLGLVDLLSCTRASDGVDESPVGRIMDHKIDITS